MRRSEDPLIGGDIEFDLATRTRPSSLERQKGSALDSARHFKLRTESPERIKMLLLLRLNNWHAAAVVVAEDPLDCGVC